MRLIVQSKIGYDTPEVHVIVRGERFRRDIKDLNFLCALVEKLKKNDSK